ncbi:TrbC/VirB2 family protein [Acidovorax facilis]|jgi:type IV secretory pathway VirB2 component (pilin)|uniref:TrbC/VirB2 family protein n=1 Tax=Acidovorax facilis TaxID=12917 RepID=UPI003D65C0F1
MSFKAPIQKFKGFTRGEKSASTTANYILPVLIAILILIPEAAMAASDPWDNAANKVLEIFTGGLARTIAIIAVIACGITALAGKLSWDWAIKIIIGIVLIFGAPALVDYVKSAAGT